MTQESGPESPLPDSIPDQKDQLQSSRSVGQDDAAHTRAAATGDEAALLKDAGHRVEAVTTVLAHLALDHHGESSELVDGMIRLLDQAGQKINQATEP